MRKTGPRCPSSLLPQSSRLAAHIGCFWTVARFANLPRGLIMTLALPIPMEACGFALNLHRIFFISSTLRLLGNLQLTPIRGVTYKKAFHTLLKLAETIKKPSLLLSFGRNYRLDKKKKRPCLGQQDDPWSVTCNYIRSGEEEGQTKAKVEGFESSDTFTIRPSSQHLSVFYMRRY